MPLVVDYDDPEYSADAPYPKGARIGSLDYEALIAEGSEDYAWHMPDDEWDAISLNYTSGHHRQSEGRRLPSPRRRPDGLRQHHPRRHAPALGLFVDVADVPLQRLVLPVDAGGYRLDPCLPALGPRQGHVRRDCRPRRHPSVRCADRHVDAARSARRRQARVLRRPSRSTPPPRRRQRPFCRPWRKPVSPSRIFTA